VSLAWPNPICVADLVERPALRGEALRRSWALDTTTTGVVAQPANRQTRMTRFTNA
jgi:hypothetical protein